MNAVTRFAPLLGRILIGQIFLLAGLDKIGKFSQVAAGIAGKGLPLAQVLLATTIIVEVGGALMILLGWRARLGAAALFLWMIPVTLLYHNFWAMDGSQAYINQIMFQKNLAMMGAMLLIVAFGSGSHSLKKD